MNELYEKDPLITHLTALTARAKELFEEHKGDIRHSQIASGTVQVEALSLVHTLRIEGETDQLLPLRLTRQLQSKDGLLCFKLENDTAARTVQAGELPLRPPWLTQTFVWDPQMERLAFVQRPNGEHEPAAYFEVQLFAEVLRDSRVYNSDVSAIARCAGENDRLCPLPKPEVDKPGPLRRAWRLGKKVLDCLLGAAD